MILVVDGQRIYNYEYQEPPPIATNSLGFLDIEFRLSEEWDGHICTAQFVQHKEDGTDFIASKVLYNNHVTFPDGIIPGVLEISLFGYKAGEAERGTTFPYLQPVYRSGFTSTEATPIPPTPDLYAQLLAQIQQGGSGSGYILPTATKQLLGGIKVGEDLKIAADGTLSVDKVTEVADNTKPITAAAVYKEVGNINALLATI